MAPLSAIINTFFHSTAMNSCLLMVHLAGKMRNFSFFPLTKRWRHYTLTQTCANKSLFSGFYIVFYGEYQHTIVCMCLHVCFCICVCLCVCACYEWSVGWMTLKLIAVFAEHCWHKTWITIVIQELFTNSSTNCFLYESIHFPTGYIKLYFLECHISFIPEPFLMDIMMIIWNLLTFASLAYGVF